MFPGMSFDPGFVAATFEKKETKLGKQRFEWRTDSLGGVGIVIAMDGDHRAPDACGRSQEFPIAAQFGGFRPDASIDIDLEIDDIALYWQRIEGICF